MAPEPTYRLGHEQARAPARRRRVGSRARDATGVALDVRAAAGHDGRPAASSAARPAEPAEPVEREAEAAQPVEQLGERPWVAGGGDVLVLVDTRERQVERDHAGALVRMLHPEGEVQPAQDAVVLARVDLHVGALHGLLDL